MPHFSLRVVALAAALLPRLTAAGPLSLDEALALALQRSEATRAARAGVASASEAARAAGQLPGPMLRAVVENLPVTGIDRFSTTRDSMTMKRIGVSQEWLSRDKRTAREAAAEAMVDQAALSPQIAAADTRLQTALAYLDAWYAAEALALATQGEHHAHEELEATRARLTASAGGSAEVLALGTARGLAEDELADVRQQQSAARVSLERWVGAGAKALSAVPAMSVPPEAAYVAASPTVLSLQREIEVARRSAAVSAAERKPNWTWEVSYGQRTGYSDMVSFGVSIPLQIAPADRQDRETAAKLALVDKAQAELAESTRTIAAEYRALRSDVERLRERIERYRIVVIAPAAQRTAATLAAFRSNQAPLTTLFEARHAELQAQRKLLALQRELAKTQARLTFRPLTFGATP
jgi:outer membrane protein, heavy metal efflux system